MGIGGLRNVDSNNTALRENIPLSDSLVSDPNSLVRLERSEPDASFNEVSETNLTLF